MHVCTCFTWKFSLLKKLLNFKQCTSPRLSSQIHFRFNFTYKPNVNSYHYYIKWVMYLRLFVSYASRGENGHWVSENVVDVTTREVIKWGVRKPGWDEEGGISGKSGFDGVFKALQTVIWPIQCLRISLNILGSRLFPDNRVTNNTTHFLALSPPSQILTTIGGQALSHLLSFLWRLDGLEKFCSCTHVCMHYFLSAPYIHSSPCVTLIIELIN